jgi:hypothetical protein
VSWAALLSLAVASYGLKALGPVFAGERTVRPDLRVILDLVAIPVLAGLIAVQTLGGAGRHLVLDARMAALAVAAILVWRRAPFLVVVLGAAATAAALRALA